MKALLWKKLKEIKGSRSRRSIFLLLPFVYGLALLFFKIPNEIIIAYFCMCVTLLNNFVHWNVEDLIYSEALLNTHLRHFSYWGVNCLLTVLSGFVYSYIIMISFSLIYYFIFGVAFTGLFPYFYSLLTLPVLLALIGFSTVYYVDLSKFKQYLTFIVGIFDFIFPLAFIWYGKYLPVNIQMIIIFIPASIILAGIAILLAVTSKKEKLIINIQKLSDAYNTKVMNS